MENIIKAIDNLKQETKKEIYNMTLEFEKIAKKINGDMLDEDYEPTIKGELYSLILYYRESIM